MKFAISSCKINFQLLHFQVRRFETSAEELAACLDLQLSSNPIADDFKVDQLIFKRCSNEQISGKQLLVAL